MQLSFQAFLNSNSFNDIKSLLDIFFFNFGILTFKDLINFKYSKNLRVETVFLTTAAIHKPTKKLSNETPIALTVKANALTDQKDPLEITIKLDGSVYLGESEVEVENIIPRLNAITDQNLETRIYLRGDRVIAYGRIMEIMSIINSAGYKKVALVTQNINKN